MNSEVNIFYMKSLFLLLAWFLKNPVGGIQ